MALKNKSMYAILGILNLSPCTGYDIKKYCDRVLTGFWNENFGHIYPTLKMLRQEGMIEEEVNEESDKRIRYHITSRGQQELQAWLIKETEQQPVRSEFMLKLLFSNERPKDDVIAMLQGYRSMYETNLANYYKMQQDLTKEVTISKERSICLNAILRRGILSDEAVIKWCDETILALKM